MVGTTVLPKVSLLGRTADPGSLNGRPTDVPSSFVEHASGRVIAISICHDAAVRIVDIPAVFLASEFFRGED